MKPWSTGTSARDQQRYQRGGLTADHAEEQQDAKTRPSRESRTGQSSEPFLNQDAAEAMIWHEHDCRYADEEDISELVESRQADGNGPSMIAQVTSNAGRKRKSLGCHVIA